MQKGSWRDLYVKCVYFLSSHFLAHILAPESQKICIYLGILKIFSTFMHTDLCDIIRPK